MLESRIQSNIRDYLKKTYKGSFVYVVNDRNTIGIPDIYFQWCGVAFWFEVKQPGKKARAIQLYNIDLLNKNGAVASVVTSVNEVVTIINREIGRL